MQGSRKTVINVHSKVSVCLFRKTKRKKNKKLKLRKNKNQSRLNFSPIAAMRKRTKS